MKQPSPGAVSLGAWRSCQGARSPRSARHRDGQQGQRGCAATAPPPCGQQVALLHPGPARRTLADGAETGIEVRKEKRFPRNRSSGKDTEFQGARRRQQLKVRVETGGEGQWAEGPGQPWEAWDQVEGTEGFVSRTHGQRGRVVGLGPGSRPESSLAPSRVPSALRMRSVCGARSPQPGPRSLGLGQGC